MHLTLDKPTGQTFQPTYGLLRIIACFSVIFHHFLPADLRSDPSLNNRILIVINNLLMCNNGLFLLLSGKFALENYRGSIGTYYKKKFISIFLPAILMSLFYYLFFILKTPGDFQLAKFLKALSACEILGYLWFVYALLGFYLVVPFLAPMLKNMNKKELRFFFCMMLFLIFLRNICQVTHIRFVFGNFPFFQLSFMLFGYLIEHIDLSSKMEKLIYLTTIPAMVVSCYIELYFPNYNPAQYDLSISRILMCLSVYLLVCRHSHAVSDPLVGPIAFVSRHTYFMYLIHTLAQQFFFAKMWSVWLLLLRMPYICALFFGSIVIFLLSLVLAMVLQFIFDMLTKRPER